MYKRRGPQTGFTLVEVLVVVVLMALMAALLLPNISVGDKSKQQQFAQNAHILFAALAEESVFSGELLALEITAESLTPLRFVSYDDGFKPYQQSTGSIKPLPLPDVTSLRWQAEDELLSAEESADAGTLQQWQASSRAIVGSHTFAERAVAPDVFFYPSGETSPGELRIYTDSGAQMVLSLSMLGQTKLEHQE